MQGATRNTLDLVCVAWNISDHDQACQVTTGKFDHLMVVIEINFLPHQPSLTKTTMIHEFSKAYDTSLNSLDERFSTFETLDSRCAGEVNILLSFKNTMHDYWGVLCPAEYAEYTEITPGSTQTYYA